MKIFHLSASDLRGGAPRAGYRIHRALVAHSRELGLESRMIVADRLSDDPAVEALSPQAINPWRWRLENRLANTYHRWLRTSNSELHSLAIRTTGLGQQLACSQADIIHLHWFGEYTISIEEIGRIVKPLVWTLHDQWPFCGAEHYVSPPPEVDERFAEGYTAGNRPSHEGGFDLNRHTWRRKRRSWTRSMSIACPSTWMADCARRSVLMRDWPISVIPYAIDLEAWAPFDQTQARLSLDLPQDRPLVLFGAVGGTTNYRKGADLLLEALQRLQLRISGTPLERLELVVFGQAQRDAGDELGFPVHFFGNLQDDRRLRLLYCASDVMVVPSRQEAFGQTASEAHACGIPVVAFRTGGLPDIIREGETGRLADPFDPESLAMAIAWVLQDPERRRHLGAAARQRAAGICSPQRVATAYAQLYRRALADRRMEAASLPG